MKIVGDFMAETSSNSDIPLTVIWKKSFRTKRINKDSVHYHKKAIGAATGDNSK